MMKQLNWLYLLLVLLLVSILAGCAEIRVVEVTTPEGTAAVTLPTETPAEIAADAATATASSTPESTLTPTAVPTDTPAPPTDTPTPTPPPTDTPVAATNTPTPTPTPTHTSAPPTPTPTPAPPTATPIPTTSPVEALLEQGIAAFEQEQWDQAIAAFEEVIRLEPAFGLAYGFLGYSRAAKQEYQLAIQALEKYLELEPAAEDRAQVEADIAQLRQQLALQPPPGKARFVLINYTGEDWNIDVGPHFLQVPRKQPDQEFSMGMVDLDPGTYTWQAHSPGGGYYITDDQGNRSFEFTVTAGEIYQVPVR
jgi:tetratricopeptide (TPR) repeat protein